MEFSRFSTIFNASPLSNKFVRQCISIHFHISFLFLHFEHDSVFYTAFYFHIWRFTSIYGDLCAWDRRRAHPYLRVTATKRRAFRPPQTVEKSILILFFSDFRDSEDSEQENRPGHLPRHIVLSSSSTKPSLQAQ